MAAEKAMLLRKDLVARAEANTNPSLVLARQKTPLVELSAMLGDPSILVRHNESTLPHRILSHLILA